MKNSFEQAICDILVKKKIITQEDSLALQKDFKGRSKETIDMFLLSEGIVEKKDLLDVLSQYYQVPSFDVVGHFFKHDLLLLFPQDLLIRHAVIPLERDENILVFVVSEPDNSETSTVLNKYVSDDIQFYVGLRQDIIDVIQEFYDDPPFEADDDSINVEDEEYEDIRIVEDVLSDDENE